MYEIYEKLLAEHGMTTTELCKIIDINPSTIANWKRRGGNLSIRVLSLIADYFGVSVEYLQTGQEVGNHYLNLNLSFNESALIAIVRGDDELCKEVLEYAQFKKSQRKKNTGSSKEA